MAINKGVSKMQKISNLQVGFLLLKVTGVAFVSFLNNVQSFSKYCETFNVSPNVLFTTSELMCDYYL